jgi:hypothetical protein
MRRTTPRSSQSVARASRRRKARSWEMVMKAARVCASSASSQAMAAMSRWFVGSSSSIRSGASARSRASAARRRSPPEARSAPGREIEVEPLGRRLHAPGLRGADPRGGEIAERGETAEIWVLFEIADAGAIGQDAAPRIGLHQARHHLHQGGFSRPVAPHQRQPVAALHDKVEPVEHRRAAEAEGQIR